MVLYNISKKESLKASIMSELTEVVLGGSKRFECRVLGYPRPEIRWYKDGIEITHVKRYNFAHSNDGVISMLMEDISHKDQGTYRCRADNSEGTASTSAYLFVRQRRGHVDDDTVSVHSMTLSEVDKDYEDRQIEFESIAKRMQMDFCDEDEFIQKKTFEDIVSEEGREKQINSQYAFDAVRKEKYESSMSNGYYEEECSSQKITSKEEFQSETISEVHIYEESKSSSTKSETSKKSSTTSKQSSKTSALESSMNSEFGPDSGFDSISASMKQDSSLLEIEATFSSSEIDNQSIITAESSLDNTTTTNSSKSKTDEEQSPSLLSSNVEVNETETSSSNETIVKTESSVDNVTSTPQSDKDNMNMTTKIEVEEKTASTKSKSETVIESETSISSSSLEVKEEKNLTITSSEIDIEEQKKNEGLLLVDHDVEVQNGNNSKDGDEVGLKLESSCVDIQQAESQETTNGSLLVDHSVEIESSKFKRKKRMSVEMEVEEKRSEDFSVDSKTTKAKKIADMKTMTAEMMTMSKDNVPTDMGSVSSIFSLVSEEGVEESSVPLNPSELLEAKLRNKIQSSVKEIDVASEPDNVDDSVFVESNEESLKETTSTAPDEKTADLTESRIQRTLSQTEEQLESASSIETTEKLKSNTPDAETPKAIEITEDIEHSDTAKPVEREPVFVDEQNILSDDAQSVSNVDSVSSEDLSISSQIDVTELTKAKAKQETAHADELLGGKDDVSVVSEIPDVESVETEQLSTDDKEVSSKKQSEKETTFVDEMLSRDDVSVVSDVTDVDTAVADESAVSIQTGIPRVSSDTSLHVEQMSVAGSEVSELEVDDNVACSLDVTEEEDSKKCLDQQTREKMMVDEMEAYCKEETSSSSSKSNEKEEALEQKVESQLISKDSVTVGDDVELLDSKLVDPPSPEIVEARSDVEQDLVFTSEIETSEFRKEPDEVEQKLIVETSVSSKSDMIIDTEVEVSDEQYSKNDPTVIATSVEETKLYAPEVVRVPDDTSVECGETVHLIAEVKGNPNPDVKWFKEGEKVCENQRVTLVTEEDVYSMEIRKAESSDSGTYTLTAHNTEGTIFSDVHVKVLGASGEDNSGQNISIEAKLTLPKFTKKPESSYTVSEFDPVQFVCEVEGDPEPEVIWMKEGQRLKSDQKRRIYKSDGQHYLEIPQSSILDAGEYECHATNSEGSAHCYISLVVEAATEQESGLSAAEEVQPVASESDVRTRYLKLFGAAGVFTLVAFGLHKLTQGKLPTSR